MCFKRRKPVEFTPSKNKGLSYQTVHDLLRQAFPDAEIYLGQEKFWLCSYDDIAYILAQDETNKFGYDLDSYRCSDFAAHLYGQFSVPGLADLALGQIWTFKHAFNIMIMEDFTVLFIEPQTDVISEVIPKSAGEKVRFIQM